MRKKRELLEDRRTWDGRGFVRFKNQDPDRIKWLWNGKVYITDLKMMRAYEKFDRESRIQISL